MKPGRSKNRGVWNLRHDRTNSQRRALIAEQHRAGDTRRRFSCYALLTPIAGILVGSCGTNSSMGPGAQGVPIVINEFMASNQTDTIVDEGGNAADWLELYNTGAEPFDLRGLYLSDDSTRLKKFALSDTVLPSGGHYLIWADDDESKGPRHANFKLNASVGEEIILSTARPEIVDRIVYYDVVPARQANFSYGRAEDGGQAWSVQSAPTPGAKNITE